MALNPLVSLIGRLVARSGRKRGNRQTDNDKPSTVTLAAHAGRGLIIILENATTFWRVKPELQRLLSISELQKYSTARLELTFTHHNDVAVVEFFACTEKNKYHIGQIFTTFSE